jgi:putative membrane protein
MWYQHLPHLNACLNSLSLVLLILGYRAIRRRQERRHVRLMLTALAVSTLFLASYLTYHAKVGHTAYAGTGAVRAVYLSILVSHIILAALTLPLALTTVTLAARRRFDRHRRWARWTLPIWLYVSVTGVVVYLMLYWF